MLRTLEKTEASELPYIKIDNSRIDQLFFFVVNKLKDIWTDFFIYELETFQIQAFILSHGSFRGTSIDYTDPDVVCAFNKAFFLKNLYKNLMMMSYLEKMGVQMELPTYDLGSGMGPSTIAWRLLSKNKEEAVLIDSSPYQLKLAKKIMKILGINNIIYLDKHIDLNVDKLNGTIFLSYWFCEQPLSTTFLENYKQLKKSVGHSLILIDYPERIEEFKRTLTGKYVFEQYYLETKISSRVSKYVFEDTTVKVHGCYYKPK